MKSRQFFSLFGRQLMTYWSIVVGAMTGFIFGYAILNSFSNFIPPSSKEIIQEGSRLCAPQTNRRIITSKLDDQIEELQKKKQELVSTLYKETRLLCWVMTEPKRVQERAAIMETWGKRCQLTLFMVGAKDMLQIEHGNSSNSTTPKNIPPTPFRRQVAPNAFMVYLDMEKDHYDLLWTKTRLAFAYIENHFKNRYDWVLKVDDDSFVIMENLRLFLRGKKPEDPFYYGCQYKSEAPRGYASGGPGYILSRVNVQKFVALMGSNDSDQLGCSSKSKAGGAEDGRLGVCLHQIGIAPADTRDESGRFRFSPFTPEMTINQETLPSKYHWFWEYSAHRMAKGFECCSDSAISFHYVTPTMIRVMEYLVYYIHPFSSRKIWNDTYFEAKI